MDDIIKGRAGECATHPSAAPFFCIAGCSDESLYVRDLGGERAHRGIIGWQEIVVWLFGPHFMLLSTVILIPILFYLDRAPKALADDFR